MRSSSQGNKRISTPLHLVRQCAPILRLVVSVHRNKLFGLLEMARKVLRTEVVALCNSW